MNKESEPSVKSLPADQQRMMDLREARDREFAFPVALGSIGFVSASVTPVMGGFNVQIIVEVNAADGEWLYGVPKCQLYRDEVKVGPETGMAPHTSPNLWIANITGVYPEPTSVKIWADFIDAGFDVSTVTIVEPI